MDNLDNEVLISILSEFLDEQDIPPRLEQLNKDLSDVSDKWVEQLPRFVSEHWHDIPIEMRCVAQLLCIKISDLEFMLDDYESSTKSG